MVLSTVPPRVSFCHGKLEADPLGPRTQDVAIELFDVHGLWFHWKQFSLAQHQIILNMEMRAFEPGVVLSSSSSAERCSQPSLFPIPQDLPSAQGILAPGPHFIKSKGSCSYTRPGSVAPAGPTLGVFSRLCFSERRAFFSRLVPSCLLRVVLRDLGTFPRLQHLTTRPGLALRQLLRPHVLLLPLLGSSRHKTIELKQKRTVRGDIFSDSIASEEWPSKWSEEEGTEGGSSTSRTCI